MRQGIRALSVLLMLWNIFFLTGCYPTLTTEPTGPDQALVPVRFFKPTFHDDMDLSSLRLALERNLTYLDRLDPNRIFNYGPHQFTCRQIRESQKALLNALAMNPDEKALNDFIRSHFRIYRAVGRVGNRQVLFTGYFEPIFEGRLSKDSTFRHPIYRRPEDLITIDLSQFNKKFRGQSIIARIEGDRVLPYYTRAQIEVEEMLTGRELEIAWLKDPVDVAFLHIQGSGRIRLENGAFLSVGYQTSNGRSYRSIGRYMIEKGYLTRENISMQRIRSYLQSHPEITAEVLNYNPSYIFFRPIHEGPFGNINVPLTPGRSVALDAKLFPKGALCFICTQRPVINDENEIINWIHFSRFVLTQDTGGAIKGAGRADIFWGSGPYAELAAGHMRHEGELYVLIKKPES
jgi:membrane-bound lytic murein transglycosylase A